MAIIAPKWILILKIALNSAVVVALNAKMVIIWQVVHVLNKENIYLEKLLLRWLILAS